MLCKKAIQFVSKNKYVFLYLRTTYVNFAYYINVIITAFVV